MTKSAAIASPPSLLESPLSRKEANRLADSFRVLSDPGRLRLLGYIASHEGGECCVCDLVDPVGLSQPTVSHHLKVLHDAGLLTREKRGVWVYYRVVPERLETLRRALG